jgi:hypothetical protein
MGSRLRIAGRVMALAALAVLMSACLKLDMDLNVSSDDTVSGTVIFAVDKNLLQISGQSFDDLLGSSAPLPSGAEGVVAKDYEDDQFAGKEYTFDSVPLAQFSGESAGDLSITRDGDVFHVSGTLDLSTVGATGPSGLSGFDPSQFLQNADLRIRITFPGEVTDANGEVSGNSVTWLPKIGEATELQATASASGGGGSSTTILLIVAAVVVVLAVVLGIVLARRRGRAAVAAAGPDGGISAPGMAPTSPPSVGPTSPPSMGSTPQPPAAPAPPPEGPPAPPPPPPGPDRP